MRSVVARSRTAAPDNTRTSGPPDLGRGSPSVVPRVARSPPIVYRRGSTTTSPFTSTGGSPLGKVYVSSAGSSAWSMDVERLGGADRLV